MVHFPLEVRAFICHFHFPGCAVRGVSWGATYAHLGGQMASVVKGGTSDDLEVGWGALGQANGHVGVVDRRLTLQVVISQN